jgi:hypothetical protein
MIRIVPVRSGADLRRFVDLPWRLFGNGRYPQWVPPLRIAVRDALDAKRNPFYNSAARQLFLAYSGDRLVGRIGAIHNAAHNAFHDDRVGFFGFFECANDQEAADTLFQAAADWLRGRDLDTVRGPMNPSTNQECGLLVHGFDQHPMIMTTWNPPYYADLVERAGFAKAKDLLAFRLAMQGPEAIQIPARYGEHAARAVASGGFTFRDLRMKDFAAEVERCWEIYNSAWEPNWGFVPMTRAQFQHEAQLLKHIAFPQFMFMAEVNGVPAGFMVLVPDYHHAFKAIGNGRLLPFGLFKLLGAKKQIRTGRIMILGVKPQYRTRSIFALFAHELYRRGAEFGITEGEASWILEDNPAMVRPMYSIGGTVYRKWRIYDRPIA